ncbi:MAG: beta-ketoacyl synthase chain length factor [Treponema sp.]|nr:beta-ketoacyl synthase chain length factor [Treponema sp.]
MSAGICVSHITAWAPGLYTSNDWKLWAAGERRIESSKDVPKLEYTDSLFRRRLSQISRMTIQVIHDVLKKSGCSRNIKQVFVSCRGEIVREFSLSKMLIEEKSVLPAAFSLSVFNTPIALATLAFGLKGGYTVLFPSKGQFRDAFTGACAPILAGKEDRIMLVYADELPAEEYRSLGTENCIPLAFAAVLSLKAETGVHLHDIAEVPQEPASFIKQIILKDTSF